MEALGAAPGVLSVSVTNSNTLFVKFCLMKLSCPLMKPPCWSTDSAVYQTDGMSLPCCNGWQQESAMVGIRLISILCDSQDGNESFQMSSAWFLPPPRGSYFQSRLSFKLLLPCSSSHYSLLLFPLFILWIHFWANFVSRQDQGTLKISQPSVAPFS